MCLYRLKCLNHGLKCPNTRTAHKIGVYLTFFKNLFLQIRSDWPASRNHNQPYCLNGFCQRRQRPLTNHGEIFPRLSFSQTLLYPNLRFRGLALRFKANYKED